MTARAASSGRADAPVTWLYVPADRPERFDKALHSGADVVIIDLEDAIAATAKNQARDNVVAYLDGPLDMPTGVRIHVRVNDTATDVGVADIDAILHLAHLGAVRLPKVSAAADIDRLAEHLHDSRLPVYAIVESAAGIENVTAIAHHPQVAGLAIGEVDLCTETGITDDVALAWLRTRVVLAAAAAGLPPVAMSVYPRLRDLDGLAASCADGRALGMFGRAAIHPEQLPVIRTAFTPSTQEVTDARAVVTAAERAANRGHGAIALPDGRFVDAPVIASAQQTLELADRLAPRQATLDG